MVQMGDAVKVFFLCAIAGPLFYAPLIFGSEALPLLAMLAYGGSNWQWAVMAGCYLSGPFACVARKSGKSDLPHLNLVTSTIQLLALMPVCKGACSAIILIWWLLVHIMIVRGQRATPKLESRKPKRILLVGDSFEPAVDGVVTFTSNTIQHLTRQGHTVAVATFAPMSKEALHGAELIPVGGLHMVDAGHYLTLPTPTLLLAIHKFRPDVVHGYEAAVPVCFMTGIFCQLLRVPYVVSFHTRVDLFVTELPNFPWMIVGLCMWAMGRRVASDSINSNLMDDGSSPLWPHPQLLQQLRST